MTTADKETIQKYADILESPALAHVATVGPKGEPQVNPVWFGWDGEYLRFSQTTSRQKVRNVEDEKRVALSIVDEQNPYRYIEIRGDVVDIEDDANLDFINAMARKYLKVEKYPWHRQDDHRIVLVIQPRHTTAMG
jgi:PPOX class probable F420-dependent enzyme